MAGARIGATIAPLFTMAGKANVIVIFSLYREHFC